MDRISVKEVFESIQGEGPYVGYKQLFIRFCNCNLRCKYCDTDFLEDGCKIYTTDELKKLINNSSCHSVSLTGGEPLLQVDFLLNLLPNLSKKIYLETNATLYKELAQIIDYVDIISADIKLPSCTGLKPLWDKQYLFFEIASKKELFAKIVFDNSISQEEIDKSIELCKKYNVPVILQPKMNGNNLSVSNDIIEETYNKIFESYKDVRIIPQTHKFLNLL